MRLSGLLFSWAPSGEVVAPSASWFLMSRTSTTGNRAAIRVSLHSAVLVKAAVQKTGTAATETATNFNFFPPFNESAIRCF